MKTLDSRLDLNAPISPHVGCPIYQLIGQELVEDGRPYRSGSDPFNVEAVGVFLCEEGAEIFAEVLLRYGPLALETVEPHDIFLPAILMDAPEIILFHHHPDGNPNPSEYDLDLTRRVVEFGKSLGIKLRYHNIAVRCAETRLGYSVKIYPENP